MRDKRTFLRRLKEEEDKKDGEDGMELLFLFIIMTCHTLMGVVSGASQRTHASRDRIVSILPNIFLCAAWSLPIVNFYFKCYSMPKMEKMMKKTMITNHLMMTTTMKTWT